MFMGRLQRFFVIASLQPSGAGFYKRSAVECGFVCDQLNPAGAVRRLDNKPVGKLVKRNGVGLGREIVEFRQYLWAKPRLHIEANGGLVRDLRQRGAAVKESPVQNLVIERH